MFNNKILAISLLIFGVILLTVAILLTVYSYRNKLENNEDIIGKEPDKVYLLVSANKKIGIAKIDGSLVTNIEFDTVARVYDTVYLNSDKDSYIFSLVDGNFVSLGKKESELLFAYSDDNILLPYYIFRYGQSEKDSIYRVYREDGTRYGEKDFTNKKETLEYIGAKQIIDVNALPTELQDKYKFVGVLDYMTEEGNIQFIVVNAQEKDIRNAKKGIVDSEGNVILDIEYDQITSVTNSRNSVRAEKDGIAYLYTKDGKFIEIESGYDAIMYEQGYYIQKRGNNVNKIFDMNSQLVKEGIYNYSTDFNFISTLPDDENKHIVPYLLLKVSDTQYDLYNLVNSTDRIMTLSDLITKDIKNYSQDVITTALLYKSNNTWYAYNLYDLKSYKITVKNVIESALDMGYIYQAK